MRTGSVRTIAALFLCGVVVISVSGQGPKSKAPEQGYVPEAWSPHQGGLLKYRVDVRFGIDAPGRRDQQDALPNGQVLGRVSAITTDSQGEVYVFQRGKKADPILVYSADGKFLRSWGRDLIRYPHGIRTDKEGNIWAIDRDNHQIFKFTREGKLLLTLGIKEKAGADENTFNRPTDIAWAPTGGDFYISDGYRNTRVVKFNKDGKFLFTWGKKGTGPGEFNTPHSIGVDSTGLVYVSDRENNRIQIFTPDGKFVKEWTHLGCTQGIYITSKDEMWILTHRNNVENIAYDTLAGQLMKIDIKTGKILGSLESPGHLLTVKESTGEIFTAGLTGNVFRWYPNSDPWDNPREE